MAEPETDDDEFLVESWLNGRGNWEKYEQRRRALIVGSPPDVNEAFDRSFLEALEQGTVAALPDSLSDAELVVQAGNGGNEIRPWMAMAAACGHAPARTIAYAPMPEWLTGMGVSVIENP